MTTQHQALSLQALGVSFLGFIFYAPSARFVGTAGFVARIHSVQKVGVFVNEPLHAILAIAHSLGLTHIQLHALEDVTLCKELRLRGYQVIKTISIDKDTPIQNLIDVYDSSVDYFLFDTKHPSHGGTGLHFDWEQLRHIHTTTPVWMSGGIGMDDVAALTKLASTHRALNIYGVDINSRFETQPGVKDCVLISQFMKQLYAHSH